MTDKTTTPEVDDSTASNSTHLLTVHVGKFLFEFGTFQDWVNSAAAKFSCATVRGEDTLCVDAKNRICKKGLEFMRARDENAFPIRVYKKLLDG